MSVKRYAYSGVHSKPMIVWSNGEYVLSTDFDTIANELQATQCAEKMTADSLVEARAMLAKLANALEECANRFERCCIYSGSDKEFAACAVTGYRALIDSERKA